jgi:phage terminase large subunit-like protein
LEVRFQNDLVRLGPSVPQEFEEELLSFPEGEHDDWCDAAAYAHELLTGPGDWSRYSYEDDAGMFPTIPWRT